MKRSGSAVWRGALKDGKGEISTESGTLKGTPYNFPKRFETEKGTNPEELIAAAHAACFSMAFSGQLGSANLKAEKIETTAEAHFEKLAEGWKITEMVLKCHVKVPGGDKAAIQKAAENAKSGCPVSRVLNTTIKLELHIEH